MQLPVLRCRWQTTSDVVAERFVPAYECLLREARAMPPSLALAAKAVVSMYEYFRVFDYQRTMTDRLVWDAFVRVSGEGWAHAEPEAPAPSLGEFAEAWRLLGRSMRRLHREKRATGIRTFESTRRATAPSWLLAKH